jgi:predicted RNA binding protein YcfA (HicA-like mRNA interferase family)
VKTPRDVSATDLIKALRVLDYVITRQKGSHIRITTNRDGQNHEVIPNHSPIKVGTLQGILKRIAAHHHLTVDELRGLIDL